MLNIENKKHRLIGAHQLLCLDESDISQILCWSLRRAYYKMHGVLSYLSFSADIFPRALSLCCRCVRVNLIPHTHTIVDAHCLSFHWHNVKELSTHLIYPLYNNSYIVYNVQIIYCAIRLPTLYLNILAYSAASLKLYCCFLVVVVAIVVIVPIGNHLRSAEYNEAYVFHNRHFEEK